MSECGHDGWVFGCPVCAREEAVALAAMGEYEVVDVSEAKALPCPKGDGCALNKGAVSCFHCGRNWPPDETWSPPVPSEMIVVPIDEEDEHDDR